jgi:heterodisulfide reductase subunit C
MIKFGFTINNDRQIEFDKNDHSISISILKKEPTLKLCIGCGTCTATCTAGNLTTYNFRRMITLLQRGEINDLKSQVSKCMLCGKCSLACPRGVNTRNIILQINKALQNFN